MGKNIVLVGMMGVGKTAFGRQLAEALDFEFVDLDAMLEDVCGLKMYEIYRKYGKVRYAAEETLLLKKQLNRENTVIATGGAMLPNDEQLALMEAMGVAVWLKAEPKTMLRRIKKKHNQVFLAPHTAPDTAEQEILRRGAVYASIADLQLDLDKLGVDAAIGKCCEFWHRL